MPKAGFQYNGLTQREDPMAETIRRVDYFYVTAPNKPGEGGPDVKHPKRSGHQPAGIFRISKRPAEVRLTSYLKTPLRFEKQPEKLVGN